MSKVFVIWFLSFCLLGSLTIDAQDVALSPIDGNVFLFEAYEYDRTIPLEASIVAMNFAPAVGNTPVLMQIGRNG